MVDGWYVIAGMKIALGSGSEFAVDFVLEFGFGVVFDFETMLASATW